MLIESDHQRRHLGPQAHLHEFEGGVQVRDTRRVMPFHLDPWFEELLRKAKGRVSVGDMRCDDETYETVKVETSHEPDAYFWVDQ